MAVENHKDSEKRIHARRELILKVEYDNADRFLHDYAHNISRGGIFIKTDKPLEKGATLHFQISFPGLLDPLDLRGEVVWRKLAVTGEEDVNTLGMGVRFIFDDPSVKKKIDHIAEVLQNERPPADSTGKTFRILIVDDNPNIQDLLTAGFTQASGLEDLEIHHAYDGTEALQRLIEQDIDLIIADIYMPVMNGVQFVKLVRENSYRGNVPIIVISAGGEGMREMALEAGANLYIDKPLTLRNLLATVRKLLGVREAAALKTDR